jgi:tetratricopeptide (TPR) repeat protein
MQKSTISAILSFLLMTTGNVLPQDKQATIGRVGCPQCLNEGSPIARALHKADELYAQFKAQEALVELKKVLQLDPANPEALSKMSRVYIDIGDMIPESAAGWTEKKLQQYRMAEQYARKAVQADPDLTWSHFYVAASLGKIAMLSPIPKQIDLSREIQAAVEKAIALDPNNGFAYHVYGIWHRRMAEIGQMSRMMASFFLGRAIPEGDIEKSLAYLDRAVSLNPNVIAHRLELAKTYIALEKWQLARNSLKFAQQLPPQFSDDPLHKKEAQRLLQEINGR